MDKHFRVEVVTKTPNPQQAIWISQHQCVCEGAAIDDPLPSEEKAGEAIAKHLLPFGHWSPTEAAQITFNVIGMSHRVMQQITRHRIGVHFSVQSFRYTGQRIGQLGAMLDEFSLQGHDLSTAMQDPKMAEWANELFYLRPVGEYRDREGKSCNYTEESRLRDLTRCAMMATWYYERFAEGMPEEMAAGLLPMDTRQNWVMSMNVRSMCGYFDRRTPENAQLEIRWLSELLWPHFEEWVPAIAAWYKAKRYGKNKLAP